MNSPNTSYGAHDVNTIYDSCDKHSSTLKLKALFARRAKALRENLKHRHQQQLGHTIAANKKAKVES